MTAGHSVELPNNVEEMFCSCCGDILGTSVHVRDRCTGCTGSEARRVVRLRGVSEMEALEVVNRRRHYAQLGNDRTL